MRYYFLSLIIVERLKSVMPGGPGIRIRGVSCHLMKETEEIFRFLIPVVFYANEGGWVRQNTTVVGSYFIG